VTDEASIQQQLAKLVALRDAIARAIVGQRAVVEQLLIGLLAGGHCLLEGVPGLGKTLLVRSLGEALALDFRRIQFTPDLMPSDIVGTELLEEDHGTGKRYFKFQQGPVFTNLLLADELNRTPPKTQSALLKRCRNARSATPASRTRCRNRSSCSPRRIRSNRPAPIRCRKRSSTASCCTSASTIPMNPRSARSSRRRPAPRPRASNR
jgi:hypothetical protein